jgi:hypothetical protein
MRLLHFLSGAFGTFAMVACASAPAANPGPQSDSEHTAEVMAAAKRWTGTFTPTQSFNSSIAPSSRQKGNGNVELTVVPGSPDLTHVRLVVAVALEPGLDNLGWAIHRGNCGSGDPPVLAPGAFPAMQLGPNGQAKYDDNIPYTLPETGTFHLNVFRGNGTQLSNVITCAELQRRR